MGSPMDDISVSHDGDMESCLTGSLSTCCPTRGEDDTVHSLRIRVPILPYLRDVLRYAVHIILLVWVSVV